MSRDVLSICPTRNRPTELLRMVDSFYKTKRLKTDLVFYISEDDPKLEEYKKFLKLNIFNYEIGPHKYLVQVINYFCSKYPEYRYYQEVNDDHIYHTLGWDEILTSTIENFGKGWGMAFPNNTINKNPSATMVSGNIVKTLGWFFIPELRHSSTDCSIATIGNGIKRLFYAEDAVIEHRCWHDTVHGIGVRAPEDDNVKFVYSKAEEEFGRDVCSKHDFGADINKINQAISACGLEVFQ